MGQAGSVSEPGGMERDWWYERLQAQVHADESRQRSASVAYRREYSRQRLSRQEDEFFADPIDPIAPPKTVLTRPEVIDLPEPRWSRDRAGRWVEEDDGPVDIDFRAQSVGTPQYSQNRFLDSRRKSRRPLIAPPDPPNDPHIRRTSVNFDPDGPVPPRPSNWRTPLPANTPVPAPAPNPVTTAQSPQRLSRPSFPGNASDAPAASIGQPGAPPPNEDPPLLEVRAFRDFDSRNARELSMRRGELFQVVSNDRRWWKVRNEFGQVGFVPGNFLELADGRLATEVFPLPENAPRLPTSKSAPSVLTPGAPAGAASTQYTAPPPPPPPPGLGALAAPPPPPPPPPAGLSAPEAPPAPPPPGMPAPPPPPPTLTPAAGVGGGAMSLGAMIAAAKQKVESSAGSKALREGKSSGDGPNKSDPFTEELKARLAKRKSQPNLVINLPSSSQQMQEDPQFNLNRNHGVANSEQWSQLRAIVT